MHAPSCQLTVLNTVVKKTVSEDKQGEGMQMQDQTTAVTAPRNYILQQDLADLFKISPQAASMWVRQHEIPTFSIGNKRALTPENARIFMGKREIKYGKQVIAFQMLKGGSTKTSSAFNLAIRLNQYGARVLCIDLDMQGNLSDAFGVDPGEMDAPIMVNVIKKECDIQDTVVPICEGLDLIPSDFDNSVLEIEMGSRKLDTRTFFSKVIAPIRDQYDYVVIDCNPSLSTVNISVALASDLVVIPVNPDKFALKGLNKTKEELLRMQSEYGKEINYKLLFTLYDARESSSQRYLLTYGAENVGKLISTIIRRNADVKNAIDRRQSIFDIKNAPAREDFDMFAREILGVRDLQGVDNA